MKTRSLTLLMAAAMTVSAVGCSSNNTSTNSTADSTAAATGDK